MIPQESGDLQGNDRRWIRLIAILLLLVFVAALIITPLLLLSRLRQSEDKPDSSSTEAAQSLGGRIAFVTLDDQLATMNPSGGDVRQLTGLDRRYQFPTWAPDGSLVAVIGGDSLLILEDKAESNERVVYQDRSQRPFYLYWSPDSHWLGFLTSHPSGIALRLAERDELFSESRLIDIGQPFYWDWLPVGERLLIHTGSPNGESRLALLDFDGAVVEDAIASPGFFQVPEVSADGQYWAYSEIDDTGQSMLVIERLEGRERVSQNHTGQVAMGWRPTTNLLAFISPGQDGFGFQGELQVMDASTGEIDVLSQDRVVAFFWSPDGKYIAYLTVPLLRGRDVQASLDTPVQQIRSGVDIQRGRLLLDLWLADVETGDSRQLATFEPSQTFHTQFLPFFDQYALSHRLWDPSSHALLIPVVQGEVPHVTLVEIDGSRPAPLIVGRIGFWSQN